MVQDEGAKCVERPTETVGLLVKAEGVSAYTHLEGWRERIPDCRSCSAEIAGIRRSVDIRDGQQIGIMIT